MKLRDIPRLLPEIKQVKFKQKDFRYKDNLENRGFNDCLSETGELELVIDVKKIAQMIDDGLGGPTTVSSQIAQTIAEKFPVKMKGD